ncbi:MAG: hypothetical protein Q8O99_02045 [bacterium]|nr:hypothetical protein [bacterium]
MIDAKPYDPPYTLDDLLDASSTRKKAMKDPYINSILAIAHLRRCQEVTKSRKKVATMDAQLKQINNVADTTYTLLKKRGIDISAGDKAKIVNLVKKLQSNSRDSELFRRFRTMWQYNGNKKIYSNDIQLRVAYAVACLYLSQEVFAAS